MHRIDGEGNVAGQFTEGDPGNAVPATVVTDDWLNDVQENLAQFIEAAGIVLVKGTATQLTAAVAAYVAAHNAVTNPHDARSTATASRLVLRDASGRAKVADPSAADDVDTKGARDTAIAAARASADWSASLSLAAGWQAWASNANGIRYVQNGPLVSLIIGIQATQSSPPALVATLPVGLRPLRTFDAIGRVFGTGAMVGVQIGSGGTISVTGVANGEVAVAALTFPAQQ